MEPTHRLFHATRCGDERLVAEILAAEPNLVNEAGELGKRALHEAAEYDQAAIAERLLAAGADPEARSDWGQTPFEWAANMGSSHVADLLLDCGATGLNLVTAASLGKLDQVRDLLRAGDAEGRQPAAMAPSDHWPADSAYVQGDVLGDAFYGAARNGWIEVAELLLGRGADIDARGVFGGTGLHWAAIHGHEEMVDWLLKHGADPRVCDVKFQADAEGWAREGGHEELAQRIARRKNELT